MVQRPRLFGASDSQLSVSMLAGLTTNVEILMLVLDVLVEAVLPVELVCVSMDVGLTFFFK